MCCSFVRLFVPVVVCVFVCWCVRLFRHCGRRASRRRNPSTSMRGGVGSPKVANPGRCPMRRCHGWTDYPKTSHGASSRGALEPFGALIVHQSRTTAPLRRCIGARGAARGQAPRGSRSNPFRCGCGAAGRTRVRVRYSWYSPTGVLRVLTGDAGAARPGGRALAGSPPARSSASPCSPARAAERIAAATCASAPRRRRGCGGPSRAHRAARRTRVRSARLYSEYVRGLEEGAAIPHELRAPRRVPRGPTRGARRSHPTRPPT